MSDPINNRLDSKIEILIDQVGRLTEGITEFRLSMEASTTEFRSDLSEIKGLMREQADRLDRLTKVTEQQAETTRQQAETTRQQAETVDRLVKIVETLMPLRTSA